MHAWRPTAVKQLANFSARLAGKAARQGWRARLAGKAAGQGSRARQPGKAAGQGCRARLHCKGACHWTTMQYFELYWTIWSKLVVISKIKIANCKLQIALQNAESMVKWD
jgi:hypothetical protein